MSYKIQILDNDKYRGNALRFATWGEANVYGQSLVYSWPEKRKMRVVSCTEEVNSAWRNGELIDLEGLET